MTLLCSVSQWNYGIFRSGVQHDTRASGHTRLEGLQVPCDEVA